MKSSRLAIFAVVLPAFALAQGVELNTITRVEVKGSTIEVTGNKKPNFTTFTMTDPPRLVIDISEAVFSGVPDETQVGNGVVTAIKTASYGSDASAIARVLIGFEKEYETDLKATDTKLIVKVLGAEDAAVASRETAPAPGQGTSAAEPRGTGAQGQGTSAAEADQARQQQEAAAAEQRRQQEEQAKAQGEADQKRQQEDQARAAAEAEKRQQEEQAKAGADQKKQQEADARAAAEAERQKQKEEAAAKAAQEKEQKAEEARAAAEAKKQEREEAAAAAADEKQQKQEEARAAAEAKKKERADAAAAAAQAKQQKQEEARAAAEAKKKEREDAAAQAAQEKQQKQEEARAAAEAKKKAREDAAAQAAEEKRQKAEEARAAREQAQQGKGEQGSGEQEKEQKVAVAETRSAPEAQQGGAAAETDTGSALNVSSRRKTVALVGFKNQANASRVFVRTNEPVRYQVSRGGGNSVVLELENTRLGVSNNARPLDTSFFDGAVAMVDPSTGPTKTVRIEIKLKQAVPYQTRQEGNEVYIEFEKPPRH